MSKRNLERRGPRSVASVVNCAECIPKSIAPPCLLSYESLSAGSLLRRYKRFLGDALVSDSLFGCHGLGTGLVRQPGIFVWTWKLEVGFDVGPRVGAARFAACAVPARGAYPMGLIGAASYQFDPASPPPSPRGAADPRLGTGARG